MKNELTQTVKNVLKQTQSILLVDWASKDIPQALIGAGYTVYSYSPGSYSLAELEKATGNLTFTKLSGPPSQADLVYIYRPEAEHAAIIEEHVLPLKAKAIWLHPPVTADKTAYVATEKGLIFIEGISITDVINTK